MVAGSLHDRVRFERRANTVDDFGNQGGVWETIVETRARIRVLSGREPELADKAESTLTVEVTVRYQAALASLRGDDRMVDVATGEVFDILWTANKDRRSRMITLRAEKAKAYADTNP